MVPSKINSQKNNVGNTEYEHQPQPDITSIKEWGKMLYQGSEVLFCPVKLIWKIPERNLAAYRGLEYITSNIKNI